MDERDWAIIMSGVKEGANLTEKEKLRLELKRQTKEFLKKGGEVITIPPAEDDSFKPWKPVSGEDPYQHFEDD